MTFSEYTSVLVLAFQEIYGTKEKFEFAHVRLHQNFYVLSSFSDRVNVKGDQKQDEAGVALAFAKHESTSSDYFTPQVFAPRRVLRVSALTGWLRNYLTVCS